MLDAVDHQLDLEHDGIVLLAVKTDDVAASLEGVLGEDGRDGLEDGVADKIAVGGLCLPVADELLVQLQSLLVQAEFVFEGDGKPDVANDVSIDLTNEGWDLPVSSNELQLNRHVTMSILAQVGSLIRNLPELVQGLWSDSTSGILVRHSDANLSILRSIAPERND